MEEGQKYGLVPPGPPDEGGEGQDLDISNYIQLFLDYRWWIVGVTLAATLAGAFYAFLKTPAYTASATVFIDRGAQKGPKDLGNVVSTDLTAELYYNSQLDIMQSREVLQTAFDALHLENHPLFAGKAYPLEAFKKMVSVQRKRDSALFTLSVTAPDQKDVAAWANALADAYGEVSLKKKLEILQEADRLMAEQAGKMEKEYERLKRLYGDQLAATGSYFPENQKEILDKRIEGLELRLNDVAVREGELGAIVGQISALQDGSGEPASLPASYPDPSLQDMTRQYNEMVRDLGRLSQKFTPQHPDVKSLRARIAHQGEAILSTYRRQLAALRAEKASLGTDLASLKAQAIAATQRSGPTESLQAGVEAVRKYMELVTDKMREVDVAASLMTNTVQVVDRAQVPRSPSKPNKKMVLLLSFMLGLMGSAGSVLALQVVDRRVKDPEILEKRFGLPLLCAVPTHTEETRTFAVEAFLNLRTSLLYASDHKSRKTWMVVSSSAAEGKSAVSANLAITMASAGDRVLLVDGDLRKPTLHNYFKQERAPGLPEFLAQDGEDYKPFLRETGKANLWLMPAGKTPPNPPILFDTDKFLRFAANARHDFDWVIFDTPPTLAVTDSLRLAEHAEGIILVARYRKTVLPLVERTLAEFARVNKPVTGVVLNQFEWNRHYYYQNYYYRHYRYYYAKDPPLRFWGRVARSLRHVKKTTSTGAGPAVL